MTRTPSRSHRKADSANPVGNSSSPNSHAQNFHEQALALLQKCSDAKTTDEALKIITDEACVLVGGRGGSIWLVSADDPNKIVLRWTYHHSHASSAIGLSSYTNKLTDGYYDGLTGWVFATGKALCLRDIMRSA